MTRTTTDWLTRGWRALALAAAFSGATITLAQSPRQTPPQAPPGDAAAAPAAATPTTPWAGAIEIDPSTIQPREGKSYLVNLPDLEGEADASGMAQRSTWILLEDGLPLGPGHSLHASIAADGAGRYSHWKGVLFFSSSDGTDPRSNERKYTFVNPVDPEGHRLHFPGAGAILIVQIGDRIWWPDPEPQEMFAPRFGSRRLDVNPSMPRRDGNTLVFDEPGEFGVRSPHRSVRVLVLRHDREQWARQIVGFVAANTTGGRADEPARIDGVIDWPTVSRAQFHHLFSTEDSLDVACGQSSRMVVVLAQSIGLQARYCGWIGGDEAYAGHMGVEIFNTARKAWEYYDPHFGLSARNRGSALALGRSLNDTYAGRESEAFVVLVDKVDSGRLSREWASYKTALQMWLDQSRRTSLLLLLLCDAIPATLDPEQFEETEFLSASEDLARFKAQFYEPAFVRADAEEPAR